jgi:hypothetical protein
MNLNGLLFPAPKPSYTSSTFGRNIIEVPTATDSDNRIVCVFLPYPYGLRWKNLHSKEHSSTKVIIYFHGNAEDVGVA